MTATARSSATSSQTPKQLAAKLRNIDEIELLNDGSFFPIVALRASEPQTTDLNAVSHLLRERGWIVPAYTLPANADSVSVLRMVVKENFSRDMVDMLCHDLHGAFHAPRAKTTPHPQRPRRRPHC